MPFFNCSVAKLDTHFDSYFPHNPNKVKTMGNAKIGSRTYWVGGTLICSKGHLIEHVRGEKIGQALLKPDKSGSTQPPPCADQAQPRPTASLWTKVGHNCSPGGGPHQGSCRQPSHSHPLEPQ